MCAFELFESRRLLRINLRDHPILAIYRNCCEKHGERKNQRECYTAARLCQVLRVTTRNAFSITHHFSPAREIKKSDSDIRRD